MQVLHAAAHRSAPGSARAWNITSLSCSVPLVRHRRSYTWCRNPNPTENPEVYDGTNEGNPRHKGLSSTDRRRSSMLGGAEEGAKRRTQQRHIQTGFIQNNKTFLSVRT